MLTLYHSGGVADFMILGGGFSREKTRTLLKNAVRLLRARGEARAAEILSTIPFRVVEATNSFGDDFSVLHAEIPLEQYEKLRKTYQSQTERHAFRQIAAVISEIGPYTRFIAADLSLDRAVNPEARSSKGLKELEINKLVYRYIGVSSGYLGDFSRQSHHEFYMELDLDMNPYDYDGTTRERFMKILSESPPATQARILEGILERFPVGSSELRTEERRDEIGRWIARLRGSSPVETPALRITSAVVERALSDAEELLRTTGASSGVDRVHTALHGYLRALSADGGIKSADDASLPELFKQICKDLPAFKDIGPRPEDVLRVLRALGAILDTLNPLRNKASLAHPNPELLPEAEAMLIINSVRTILHYLDEKAHNYSTKPGTE